VLLVLLAARLRHTLALYLLSDMALRFTNSDGTYVDIPDNWTKLRFTNYNGTYTDIARSSVSTGLRFNRGNGTYFDVAISSSSVIAANISGNATSWRGNNNQRYSGSVTGASSGSLWGTDIYTDDSSIPRAAVHAGKVAVGETKTLTIEIRPGQSSYTSTTRNGVTSSSYGSWSGSYVFV